MFTLSGVVPWGRTFDEYCAMFALDDADWRGRVLGVGDGPASFNAEATARGHRVVSCDPLYRYSAVAIGERIESTADEVIAQTRKNAAEFVWTRFGSVDDLAGVRLAAMQTFIRDFAAVRSCGRYVSAALPTLPFATRSFDLAVCSHFLFLYSQEFDAAFHVASIAEMCRVAREVRVFPLLALGAVPSPHVARATAALRGDGHSVTIERVDYEFQRGGNQMMRVRCG